MRLQAKHAHVEMMGGTADDQASQESILPGEKKPQGIEDRSSSQGDVDNTKDASKQDTNVS